MNIIFNKIVLHNFGSYHHAEVSLKDRGFCLVKGKNNYVKDKSLSNGSGKSFLWSGICFALTGETINGLTKNLKNMGNDETESYTRVDFSVDADNYCVTRIIAPKSDLKIIKNGNDISGKGIRESENILSSTLPDIDRDLISTIIILGQGMPNKFSSFSPSGRKELLEKLTKSDFMIEDLKERIKTRSNELHSQISELHDGILIRTTNASATESNINKLKTKISSAVKPDFAALKKFNEDCKIKLEKHLDELNTEITQLAAVYTDYNSALVAVHSDKANNTAKLYEAYSAKVNPLNKTATQLSVEISTLKKEIAQLDKITDVCPTCHQKLIGVHKPDTTTQKQEVSKLQEQLTDINSQISDANKRNLEYKTEIDSKYAEDEKQLSDKIKNTLALKRAKEQEKSKCLLELQAASTKLVQLKLEEESWDNNITQLKDDLDRATAELSKIITEKADLEKAYDNWTAHLAVVSKINTLITRDFRGYILSNIIDYLNSKAKDYCEIVFGTRDIEIYLDGNALDISYCNKLFDNLSGGEKQRIDLILQFAIRDLLSKYFDVNSNIIVLDELTDFLDRVSCAAVMSLISSELNSTESVFIISHHPDELELPIDSTIEIVKDQSGVSAVL